MRQHAITHQGVVRDVEAGGSNPLTPTKRLGGKACGPLAHLAPVRARAVSGDDVVRTARAITDWPLPSRRHNLRQHRHGGRGLGARATEGSRCSTSSTSALASAPLARSRAAHYYCSRARAGSHCTLERSTAWLVVRRGATSWGHSASGAVRPRLPPPSGSKLAPRVRRSRTRRA